MGTPTSRQTTTPIYTKNGRKKIAQVTDRDVASWQRVLVPYPVARLNTIHAFMGKDGGSYGKLSRHWDKLQRQPSEYVYRHSQQWGYVGSFGRSTVYGLNRNGFDELRRRGDPVEYHDAPKNLEHELMWCEHDQSVELGALREGFSFANWQTIRPKTPETTRKSLTPFDVPIPRTVYEKTSGRPIKKEVIGTTTADGWPFGIGMPTNTGLYWRFFLVQADCDSEPLISKDKERSSIERHMLDAIYLLEHNSLQTHFGFPEQECYFIFITPSATWLDNFKEEVLRDLTKGKEWLREYFLFHTFSTFMSPEPASAHLGLMFNATYSRLDWEPFTFRKL